MKSYPNFKIPKEISQIIKSLEKNSEINTELGIKDKYCRKFLIPLLKDLDVFKKNNNNWKEDDFKFIAERLNFRFYKPEEVVFEYNDYGNMFYIIIEGTCSVQIPQNDKPL